jgi:hypothetical protein
LREKTDDLAPGEQGEGVPHAPIVDRKRPQAAPRSAQATGPKRIRSSTHVNRSWHQVDEHIRVEIIAVIRGQNDRPSRRHGG